MRLLCFKKKYCRLPVEKTEFVVFFFVKFCDLYFEKCVFFVCLYFCLNGKCSFESIKISGFRGIPFLLSYVPLSFY